MRKVLLFVSLLACICVAFVIASCSRHPQESEGASAVQRKIASEAVGRIRLVSFTKTDGQASELMGVKIYTMSYEMEIEFTEVCKWFHHPAYPLSMRTEPVKALQGWDKFNEAMQPDRAGEIVKVGAHRKMTGKIVFEKSEKGWTPSFTAESITPPPTEVIALPVVPTPPTYRALTQKEREDIQGTLRQLSQAADQHYLYYATSKASYADLVGPGKFIPEIKTVVGEDYTAIQFEQGKPVTVTAPNGEKIVYAGK